MEGQRKVQKQSLEVLRTLVAVSNEIREVSNNTAHGVHENGEKMDRIHDKTKEINKVLDRADTTSKEMTSFWYRWGRKLKGVFSRNEEEGSENKGQQVHQNIISGKSEKESLSSDNGTPMNEQDQLLDQMLINLKIAKKAAQNTSSELDRQGPLLQQITKNVDQGSQKMQGINKRLKDKFF